MDGDHDANRARDAADGERRPRKRLHAPLSAALAGLGLVAGFGDAAAAPVARPDAVAVPRNGILTGIDPYANDTYGPGAMLNGINANLGAYAVESLDPLPTIQYIPPSGFLGVDFINYCIGDATGNACTSIYVAVQHPNVASYVVARDDFYATTQGVALHDLQVLANDTFGASRLSVNRLFATQAIGGVPAQSPGSLGNFGYSPSNSPPFPPVNVASFMIDYVPNPGFTGLDRFQYCIDDFYQVGTQTCATVYINVLPAIVTAPALPVPAMNGYALAGLSGVLGWLAFRLRRRG